MKTLSKYFENLFDIDDDTSIVIGTEVGENGIIEDVTDKGIIVSIKKYSSITFNDEQLDKIISIGKALDKPLIFMQPVLLNISKDVDFGGIEIQCEFRFTFESTKKLTIKNLTLNCKTASTHNYQIFTFINCTINCDFFENIYTISMPNVISKKINVKEFIKYDRNTKDGLISEIYHKYCKNESNELDINKLFNLKNVNVPYMVFEGVVPKASNFGDERKEFRFFHKSNPEFNMRKNHCDLDKSKQWLMVCADYFRYGHK